MIYIIEHGQWWDDYTIDFVEAPVSFGLYLSDVLLPFLRQQAVEQAWRDLDRSLATWTSRPAITSPSPAFKIVGVAESVEWGEGQAQHVITWKNFLGKWESGPEYKEEP